MPSNNIVNLLEIAKNILQVSESEKKIIYNEVDLLHLYAKKLNSAGGSFYLNNFTENQLLEAIKFAMYEILNHENVISEGKLSYFNRLCFFLRKLLFVEPETKQFGCFRDAITRVFKQMFVEKK